MYYSSQKIQSHDFLFRILTKYYGIAKQPLLYNEQGKPYLKDNPLFFSVSHSQDVIAVAVCDVPVGLDVEYIKKTKQYLAIRNRLSPTEQAEITDMPIFLEHWTVKESYIKYQGESLASTYTKLEYTDRTLRLNGIPLDVNLRKGKLMQDYVYCICTETEESVRIKKIV